MGFEDVLRLLEGGSPLAYIIIFAGGFLTGFTPCVFPIIPIIIGFIGGQQVKSRWSAFLLSLSYVLGMALTFAVLGAIAPLIGKRLGDIQSSPYALLVVGNIILLMALWIMDIIHIQLPALQGPKISRKGYLPSFILGASSGLIAAPCTTAVLGAVLVYVGQSQNIIFGTTLLFTYGLGLGVVIIIAGTFTGFISTLMKSEKLSLVVNKIFGIGLLLLAEYFFIQAGKRF